MPDPQVWPLMANFADTIEELYGYATEILGEEGGPEQRIAHKVHPGGGIEFSCAAHVLQDAGLIESKLYRYQGSHWLVPLWMLSRDLTADAGPPNTTIACATADAPFLDPLGFGPKLLIWRNARLFETVRIDSVNPSSIDLLDELTLSWPALVSKVIPCRVGLLEEIVPLGWRSPTLLTLRVRFRFDADESVLSSSALLPEGEFVDIGAIIPTT
jgi:hypothetical protein